MLDGRRILLVISGGIAAYKSLEVIRRLRERGADVRCLLTHNATQFVTPLAVQTLSGNKVFQDTFSLTDEHEIGHITLARDCDLVVVAPATANLLSKMAHGLADDLASTALLVTDQPILVAPAMNFRMWEHPATRANLATLKGRGVHTVGPNAGPLAEGESGIGRMAEPGEIVAAIEGLLAKGPLAGIKALVTSGPTFEPIDPVRFIGNRSSGKQGHAIATALARLGADVTLITGPVRLADPAGVRTIHVETAREMLGAALGSLPADVAVCAAAVADWTVSNASKEKRKKDPGAPPPAIELAANPDILATLSEAGSARPRLVIGFAAETEKVLEHAKAKLARKGCDWIVANDVSPATGTFGGDFNSVHLISASGTEDWPRIAKADVAERLAWRIADSLKPGGAE
ncbi:fused 4'-phosphopantothenoylcysteine decarboxylase; phosphopantothenoylcysteine synthetase, FMN-binding [Magnetospirillum sp. LM-5]|uniref:bifunctional phosphopantothenoylcysteine decarboxylase/phosphopantothenate--cysteine ligase CoaBC n=1 Tax=Magnetospirillum sp. LM-5 TaxID=2681466 RepID=UPI0013863069|nr:bifunctional phosphopantothenoylcysteine decarboxylase/phosphopantothenate--cysteine ligase CoaBC [Magnetospirillum sp. LM-5]CAA7621986.1 fused 4'-phosphopantothenoylcysteine decarboxylase; phosphopantothenoylcysteine synthetase, FMN-binding [Magnetospirillum sp. LM-5]